MQTIYRIENENGNGPYVSRPDHDDWNSCYYNNPTTHPLPEEDPLLIDFHDSIGKKMKDYYFGFKSMNQLMSWFDLPSHRNALHESGFCIKIYETESDFTIGSRQVIFKKEVARVVKSFPIPVDKEEIVPVKQPTFSEYKGILHTEYGNVTICYPFSMEEDAFRHVSDYCKNGKRFTLTME